MVARAARCSATSVEPGPIVVIGSPRSGTSLVAGLFAAHGVWTGICRAADEHNPRGYFENVRLNALRTSRAATPASVFDVLESEGWRPGQPWLVKHSPSYWEEWLPFGPRFVLCRRDRAAIVASLARRGQKWDAAKDALHLRRMDEIRTKHDGVDVWPGHLVSGVWFRFERLLGETTGKPLDRRAIGEFLDRSLWHD